MRSALFLVLVLGGTALADERPTLATALKARPDLAAFTKALDRAGLLATLDGSGPFTILAPTDAALEGKRVDRDVIARHLFAGSWTAADAAKAGRLKNASGDEIEFAATDDGARAGGVALLGTEVVARNGVIHVIDGILPIPIRVEASVPEGFPAPGPADEVTLKEYPRYRAARAAGGMGSFWTLFNHIKKHDIAMTAPVEMSMTEAGELLTTTDMAFLYGAPEMGEPGRDGDVDVVDLEPTRVLSFGMFGPLTAERVKEARRAIGERLERDGLATAGDWRLLGYNSPMVPETRRFYELQLPVAARP